MTDKLIDALSEMNGVMFMHAESWSQSPVMDIAVVIAFVEAADTLQASRFSADYVREEDSARYNAARAALVSALEGKP